jgi:hypothetical protein
MVLALALELELEAGLERRHRLQARGPRQVYRGRLVPLQVVVADRP